MALELDFNMSIGKWWKSSKPLNPIPYTSTDFESIKNKLGDTPLHIAIIMDGNGRWAKSKGLPRMQGHIQGAEAVSRAVKTSVKLGINALTLYSFSTENWSRPEEEVTHLMGLFKRYLDKHLDELAEQNIKIIFLGRRDDLADDILTYIENAEKKTAHNSGLNLCIAFNYGGRDEITRAVKNISKQVEKGKLSPSDINEDMISYHLDTKTLRMPDILIRTSGEQRLSNFLIWQCAYSEFFFLEKYWPEFQEEDFLKIIHDFQNRDRRFGGV